MKKIWHARAILRNRPAQLLQAFAYSHGLMSRCLRGLVRVLGVGVAGLRGKG